MNTQRVLEMIIEYFLNHHKWEVGVSYYNINFDFYDYDRGIEKEEASVECEIAFEIYDSIIVATIKGPLNEQTFHEEVVKIERQIEEEFKKI